jgi:hypothetical protein
MGRYGHWDKHLELFEMFEDFKQDPAVREAFADQGHAGFLQEGSGAPEGRVDFPIFLQTVIRHRIRERFRAIGARWRDYTSIENAQDFRENTVSQLGAIRGIEGIQEHGEYPRLRSSEEEGPPFAVGKYGGIYAVTYELVINDETDRILNRIPQELGRSMGEYQSQAIVAFIESNPTYIDGLPFFHSSRDNEVTGGDAAITSDNLAAILDTMSLRRDSDNIPISVTPRRIIVRNPSQKLQFDQIIRSQQTGVTSDAQDVAAPDFHPGTYNPLYNILPPDAAIEEPWLNDPNDWYLLADAQDRAAFITAFLRNRQDPYIFLKDSGMRGLGGGPSDPYSMDFDEVPYKIRHVFGVAMGEPLGAIRARP